LSRTYPMFETIKVEQILEVLKRKTTDEKEIEAEMKGSQEPTISGKSLWLAAHLMDAHVNDVNVNESDGVISLYGIDQSHASLLTMQVGTDSLQWEPEYPYQIEPKSLKESLKNHKKTTKKQTDMLRLSHMSTFTSQSGKNRRALNAGIVGEGTEGTFQIWENPHGTYGPTEIKVDFNDGLILEREEFMKAAKAVKFVSYLPNVMYDPSQNAEDVVFSAKGVHDNITARVACVPVDGQYDLANNNLKDKPWSVDFSVLYLKPLLRLPKNATISIAFAGSNMPIQFDFSGEEGGTPYCGRLLIAPRVEDY